jgi:hypothetical protein
VDKFQPGQDELSITGNSNVEPLSWLSLENGHLLFVIGNYGYGRNLQPLRLRASIFSMFAKSSYLNQKYGTRFDFTFYFLAVLSLVTFFQTYAAKIGVSDSRDWPTISARTA